jgi:hypothetical protein
MSKAKDNLASEPVEVKDHLPPARLEKIVIDTMTQRGRGRPTWQVTFTCVKEDGEEEDHRMGLYDTEFLNRKQFDQAARIQALRHFPTLTDGQFNRLRDRARREMPDALIAELSEEPEELEDIKIISRTVVPRGRTVWRVDVSSPDEDDDDNQFEEVSVTDWELTCLKSFIYRLGARTGSVFNYFNDDEESFHQLVGVACAASGREMFEAYDQLVVTYLERLNEKGRRTRWYQFSEKVGEALESGGDLGDF